ncbi:MAG: type IV pilus assembly protein PilM [Nitrospinota bacterium]
MFSSNEIVGLDIGSTSVKAVVLARKRKGYELKSFAVRPIPDETIVEGVVEKPEVLSEVLKDLFASEKIKTKNIVSSLSGQSLVIKKINLPKMSEMELEETIRSEAEQYIPFDIDEVNFDFQIVQEKNIDEGDGGEEVETVDVLLVAVRKELIEERNTPLLDAGLKPVLVDLDVFAMENVNEFTNGIPDVDVLSLINIGASFININILVNGVTEVTKDLPMGGNNITQGIAKHFELEFQQAERLKKGIELFGHTEKEIAEVLHSEIKELSHEVNKMFHDFTTSSKMQIDKVMLSGGSSKIAGLDKILTDHFDISTVLLDPFSNLIINEKKIDPEYINEMAPMAVVGVGLALRNPEDRKR